MTILFYIKPGGAYHMKYFHGNNEKNGYFEGWYFKHRSKDLMLSIIAAYHIDLQGRKKASVQIITEDQSFIVWYPEDEFYASEDRLFVQIGNNIFYEHGCRLNINTLANPVRIYGSGYTEQGLCLKGSLEYGAFRPLAYDIMGPFQYMPGMQCRHGVISMAHKISGSLTLNGRHLDFRRGVGYIETDRGHTFPEKYLWLQCEEMDTLPFSIMAAVATVPVGKLHFTGCICAISYRGSQYRLATYRNVRIHQCDDRILWLSQGRYTLLIQLDEYNKMHALPLKAPISGCMSRPIKECLAGKARFRFWENKKLLFDIVSSHVSIENMHAF